MNRDYGLSDHRPILGSQCGLARLVGKGNMTGGAQQIRGYLSFLVYSFSNDFLC